MSRSQIFARASYTFAFEHRYHDYTMQFPISHLICTWAVIHTDRIIL